MDAGVQNLLDNAGFEFGCAGWEASNNASAKAATPARSGSSACLVCSTGATSYSIGGTANHPSKPGEEYRMEAWLRAPPGMDASASMQGIVQIYQPDGFLEQGNPTTGFVPTNEWQALKAFIKVTQDGGNRVFVNILAAGQTCFLIDDVLLYRY